MSGAGGLGGFGGVGRRWKRRDKRARTAACGGEQMGAPIEQAEPPRLTLERGHTVSKLQALQLGDHGGRVAVGQRHLHHLGHGWGWSTKRMGPVPAMRSTMPQSDNTLHSTGWRDAARAHGSGRGAGCWGARSTGDSHLEFAEGRVAPYSDECRFAHIGFFDMAHTWHGPALG